MFSFDLFALTLHLTFSASMHKLSLFLIYALLIVFISSTKAGAQTDLPDNIQKGQSQVRYDAQGRMIQLPNRNGNADSLKHRNSNEDSITIYYRFFDSTRIRQLDTTINNFPTRFPVPFSYFTLAGYGTAARSLLFSPNLKPGFDPGFHAFDIYKLKVETTKFYQTTRPYTELGYLLGSKAEQTVDIIHTQNVKPNFNMAFQYRLINVPGNLQNQNANHNSFSLNGNYQSLNKRYSIYGIYLSNKIAVSENGGVQNDSLLKDFRFTNRYLIPGRLSGAENPQRNPFNTRIVTGNVYSENTFLLKQQYDFGQQDSLVVNDSTVIRLFYPRLRLQHTLTYTGQSFEFRDLFEGADKIKNYDTFFNVKLPGDSQFVFRNAWKDLQNDFSIISFPEKNNQNQFIKAGITIQNLSATFSDTLFRKDNNIFLNGEYRNRTRNQKWDIEANGKFYVNGFNSGDYLARADLKRFISKKLGYIELGFQNVNRTPSFIYENKSAFPVRFQGNLNKENITRLNASIVNDANNTTLNGEYFLVSNYTYFDSFFTAKQKSSLFNVLHLSATKTFKNIWRNLSLYAEVHLQKTTGNAPVNLPLIFTTNRLVFEGVYYKNMTYAYGFEVTYHTPFKADNYSPFLGQFFYQDNTTINNRPTINAFFHFRIKTFKAFIRGENLNSFGNSTGSVGFNTNNLSASHYPQPGLLIRVGVWWTFIN